MQLVQAATRANPSILSTPFMLLDDTSMLLDDTSPAHIAGGGADLLVVLGNARRGYWDRNSSSQRLLIVHSFSLQPKLA